eukprot:79936-Lingulodinium_polyedra.AAC.1
MTGGWVFIARLFNEEEKPAWQEEVCNTKNYSGDRRTVGQNQNHCRNGTTRPLQAGCAVPP